MNGRFWVVMMGIIGVLGATVSVAAAPADAGAVSFLKSFYRVEYLNPPVQTESWTLVGVNTAQPPLRPSEMHGRWGVVNIWATWCAPCLYELPKLNTLATALTGADDPYVWAVSVDRDVSRDRLRAYITRFGLTHVAVLQDASGAVRRGFNVEQLPVTFVIAPDGGVRAALYGAAEWDSPAAVAFVRGLSSSDLITELSAQK